MSGYVQTGRARLKCGMVWSLTAAVGVAVSAPAVLKISGGFAAPRAATLSFLMSETLYLLIASVGIGLYRRRDGRNLTSYLIPLCVPALAILVAVPAGLDSGSLLRAQPASLAAYLLGAGIGLVSSRISSRRVTAAALAFLVVTVIIGSLLFISHAAPVLSQRQWIGSMLLALNPVVTVSAAGGYDIVRSRTFYDYLTLSGYRFQYPGHFTGVYVPTALGLLLILCSSKKADRAFDAGG